MLVAIDGPPLAMMRFFPTRRSSDLGPAVVNVLTIETSADAAAVPPLPVLSVLLPLFGSGSFAETVALLSNTPAAGMVAVTVMVVFAPKPRLAIVHGRAAQPPPVTLV